MADSELRFTRIRLFVEDDLAVGGAIVLGRDQSHYLQNVMRRGVGDRVALFNGRDGEYWAELIEMRRAAARVSVSGQLRTQVSEPDVWLTFAPIKRAAVDFMTTKATELGVARLLPVLTARTNSERVNTRRLRANATEAAEQSERLSVPVVDEPVRLPALLAAWPAERCLLVGDETGAGRPIAQVAAELLSDARVVPPLAVMTGPEGGFVPEELDQLRDLPFVIPVGLGPRVLRADTAALAALAVVQAVAGDWRSGRMG
ncbi:MAG: 16S rRNA (uracil(1498)-N(3))-methyltransferase [Rhodospirillaceae bacterium]|nr:16S rRNA (uracil(1498)-N(3))-methyltransferase [Rhodospirillaceae bacterium]|tara:strand:+ start:99 stop:875 length:777 start_codon:yes stop_codon:yes gene_type:complete